MEKRKEKIPVGICFMGRNLGELLELKARCRRRLEYLEQNRERISSYVYDKLRLEYSSYLEAVDGEVALGLSEYEIKLAEIRLFSNQLKLLEKSYSERIQELALRHTLGEYSRQQYDKLCADHKDRMQRFAQSIEKYSGEQRRLEEFLERVAADGTLTAVRAALEDQPAADIGGMREAEPEAAVNEAETAAEPDLGQEMAGPLEETAPEMEQSLAEVSAIEDTRSGPPNLPLEPLAPAAEPEMEFPAAAEPQFEEPSVAREPEEEPARAGIFTGIPAEKDSPRPSSAFLIDESAPKSTVAGSEAVSQIDTVEPGESPAEAESALAAENSVEESWTQEFQLSASAPVEEMPSAGVDLGQVLQSESPAVETPKAAPEADIARSSAETIELPGLQEVSEESGAEIIEPQAGLSPQPGKQPPVTAGSPVHDLESLFASSPPEPGESAHPDISQPSVTGLRTAGQEQAEAVEAVFDLEKELLQEAAGGQASGGLHEEKAEKSAPAVSGSSGGLDLDAIMNASGASLQSFPENPRTSSPAAVVEEPPEPEDLNPVAETGATAYDEPAPEESEEEMEPAIAPEEKMEPDTRPSYETLQRLEAAPEDREIELREPPEAEEEPDKLDLEPVISLDERIELSLNMEDRSGETDKLLTVNQAIDAIKRKTVKCPACGTMNYAIRWYCEKCEATLTSL